ncbi:MULTISPECIES: C40 family peptidase [unclassified Clostridium]|uniref:C40 family peptidase n=1 Tax=unclassified Clostridium TaxID=2614128 RepID=UPI0002975F97|nr:MULTISPECIES: C40 family peptidase [unclassified Clostridium]EKQ51894.1 MAG: cell wall-associated hydrolase, invasion-associated protein [Clostridium sp. Maddingley MBC34-26]
MKKTIKTVMFATALVMVTQVSAFAVPTSQAQTQLEQNKNSLKEAQDKRHELEASIEELDNQIEDYMMKIDANKKTITSTENDIQTTKKQITQVEKDVKDKQDALDQRVRAMYINGQSSYLKILLESESFSDLISRADAIRKIIGMDKKVISDLNDTKAEVESKKASLDVKYNDLIALKSENENKLTNLNSSIADQKKLIEDAKVQEKLYASKVDESQAVVDASMAQVKKIRSEAPKYSPSRGASTASVSDNNIIAYASNFLGTPYLWGGTSPSTGFDCSGYTQYVYAHFGISLGRTTYDQINDGYGVSRDELQPGDLVFFGKNGDPTHMGMYVGNNTYIHSPRTGDVIKISSVDRPDYITARRVK